jgi:hypothetical protein
LCVVCVWLLRGLCVVCVWFVCGLCVVCVCFVCVCVATCALLLFLPHRLSWRKAAAFFALLPAVVATHAFPFSQTLQKFSIFADAKVQSHNHECACMKRCECNVINASKVKVRAHDALTDFLRRVGTPGHAFLQFYQKYPRICPIPRDLRILLKCTVMFECMHSPTVCACVVCMCARTHTPT